MADYSLPDGKTLTVPDDASKEYLDTLQNRLVELYPETYKPFTEPPEERPKGLAGFSDPQNYIEAVRGVPAGIVDMSLGSLQGFSAAFDDNNDSALTQGLADLRKYYSDSDVYKPAEGYEDAYSSMFGKGLGSMAAIVGASIVNPLAGTAMAVGSGVDQQAANLERLKKDGNEISGLTETLSEIGGGIVGWSEVLVPKKLLKLFGKDQRSGKVLDDIIGAIKTGGFEAAQETGAGIAQNLITNVAGVADGPEGFQFNKDIPLAESAFDDATVGFGVGFAADVIMRSIGGRRAAGMEYNREQAEEQNKNLIEQDKIIQELVLEAEQQGDQILDPTLIPDESEVAVPESAEIELKPLPETPILETFSFAPNPDGSINVLGNQSQEVKGTFANIEEASRGALDLHKLNRNKFIASSALQISSINGLSGNGTATRIAQKIYDPNNNYLDAKALANFESTISTKRQQQIEKEKGIEETRFDEGRKLAAKMLGYTRQDLELMDQYAVDQLADQLSRIQTAYPVKGQVNPESQLGQFWQLAEKKGIEPKNFYTIAEAKKLLNKSDFNQFMSEKSSIKFKESQFSGDLIPISRKGNKIDVSPQEFKKTFESKNIEVDFNTPAFRYLAKSLTGTEKFSDMTDGQKEMLLSNIKSFPRFNSKTKLPNYSPRPYTADQLNSFYKVSQGQAITAKNLKTFIKNNNTGKDLTPKEINQLRIDLVESGRANKVGNRIVGATDFEQKQSLNSESFANENKEQFRERLQRSTTLLPEEIDRVVEGDGAYKQGTLNADDVLKLPSPEASEKYDLLLNKLRERLNSYGLKDVAIRFDNALKASLNLSKKNGKVFYDANKQAKGKDATSLYDRPLRTIVSSLERLDPNNDLTLVELEAKLTNDLDHEVIHALVQMNLLKQNEFDLLVREANKKLSKTDLKRIEKSYSDLAELGVNEEKVAELFRYYRNNPESLAPKPKTIIQKVLNFLTTVSQTIYDAGFTSSRTILADIESGKIGSRERGEVRNLRNYQTALNNSLNVKVRQALESPSFSRKEREDLKKEIQNLDNQIYQKTQRYLQDYSSLSERVIQNDSNEISYLENQKKIKQQKLDSLKPIQLDFPSFSRVKPVKELNIDRNNILSTVEINGVDHDFGILYSQGDKNAFGNNNDESDGNLYRYNNYNIVQKLSSDNREFQYGNQAIPWIRAYKNNGYNNSITGTKKKWRAGASLQDVADFINNDNGDNIGDAGYLNATSTPDDFIGTATVSFNGQNEAQSLLRIEIDQEARGQGFAQAAVETILSTNPKIVNGNKKLRVYDITDDGAKFWDAINTELNQDRGERYLDGELGFGTIPEPIQEQPSYNRAGLVPKNVLYGGKIEEEVYRVWADNNKNPKAKDFQQLYKKLSPTSKKNHPFVDYSTLKAEVKDAAQTGMDARWYERWGLEMPNIIGMANMNEFSGVFGITSAQATPEQNLKDSLRTMIIARKYNPETESKKFKAALLRAGVGKGQKQRIDAIQKFYELGVFARAGSSQKTLTYALEVLSSANGEFTPFMVVDRHMIRKFGLSENTESANEIEYRMMQSINSLLSTENYMVNGEPDTFTPPQIQALLWGHQRYKGITASKITNEGSFDSALQSSQQEVKELQAMEKVGEFSLDRSFSNKFLNPPRYVSNKKTDIFDTNLQRDMFDSILELAPATVINFKIGRGRGYLPEQLDSPISFERWNKFQNDSLKAITTNNKITFLRNLGIAHEVVRSAATKEGELNPNIVLKLPGASPQIQNNVAAVMVDALMQDSAIVARPTSGGKKNSLLITKPENAKFKKSELDSVLRKLSEVNNNGQPIDFTVAASKKSGIIIVDPKQFNGEPYTVEDQNTFVNLIKPALITSGLQLEKYGQESRLIEHGQDTSNSTGTRGKLAELGSKIGFIGTSDLQRTALRDLYIPLYEEYKNLAQEIGFDAKTTPAYLEENSALNGIININAEEIADAEFRVAEEISRTSRGNIPKYGVNASPIAYKIALDFEDGKDVSVSFDAPSYSRKEQKVPDKYKDLHESLEGTNNPDKSFSDTLIDLTEEGWTKDVGGYLSRMRQAFVDDLSIVERGAEKAAELSEEVRERQQSSETGAIQALRFAGQSKSLFAKMLTIGVPVYENGTTSIVPFKHGGLINIFSPLYSYTDGIDYQAMFKLYSVAQRGSRLNSEGKLVPLTTEQMDLAKQIKDDYKIIETVYDQYQEFNNALLDYAKSQGILGGTTLVESDNGTVEIGVENGKKDGKKYLLRDTVELWKENSDFYPFYRQAADSKLGGPAVISGFIGPNPLAFKLTGSEEAITPPPLEVISRNMQTILYASMKNQGMQRLMQEHELANLAEKVRPDQAQGANILPVYENGNKVFYRVADPLLIEGLQSMGMNDIAGVMKVVGIPSQVLREMVTRDPGFILKNMTRDTLSVAVTSGADFTPFLSTFKNFNADLTELENRGIIGGYDAARDSEEIITQINKLLKKEGIMDNGGLNPFESVVKIWDWLGDQTTKSDGATRKAVADAIFELTGSQGEAAYQALEVLNFNRRGGSTVAKIITTAIPFLNARIQGLDVLYRASTGRYSSTISKENLDQSAEEIAHNIRRKVIGRGLFLAMLTGIYYLLVGDNEDYRGRRAQERDDNWLLYLYDGLPPLKLAIPFEVGFIFKVIPERALDLAFGRSSVEQTSKSITRGITQTLKVNPLGFQIVKPLIEVANNKSGFTGNEIIPYHMRQGLDPEEQFTQNTTELARGLGKALKISPMKIDYVMKGYGGTLGTYLLTMSDMAVRQATGRDFVTPRLTSMPLIRNIFASPYGGGLQEQFYELRTASNRYQQTLNKLATDGRMDEFRLYRTNNIGLARTRQQVLALDRYLADYRKKKKRIELNKTMSPKQKRLLLDQLETTRDKRLAYVPALYKKSDIPSYIEKVLRLN